MKPSYTIRNCCMLAKRSLGRDDRLFLFNVLQNIKTEIYFLIIKS